MGKSYVASLAAGDMAAVSEAEVYFSPPDANLVSQHAILPNLYQPYWRAHLTDPSAAVRQAQDLQGVHLP